MAIPILSHLDFRYCAEAQNLIVHKTTEASATNTEGALIYDTGTDTIKYRNASAWVSLTAAATGTSITVADTTDTTCFVGLWEDATGDLSPKTDAGITYNAGTGMLTATGLTGPLTGNVTGNASGTALTVTQAAQTSITSLGTLTALTVDDVVIDGKVVTMTGSSGDTAVLTVGTNGTLSVVTTDTAAAAANIQITADGTAELAGTTVNLDSSGGIDLDADSGVISFNDAGVSLGTISSSGYSGVSATATALATARSISMTGDVAWTVSFDGSAVVTAASTIQANAVDSAEITSGAIDLAHMSVNSVDSDQYVDGSIDNAHLAANSVDSDNYVDGSIDNAHIADDAIDSEHYADGSIDNAHIADDAIDSEHYAAGSIDTAHIADDQITLAKMAGLATTKFILGNGSGNPAAVSMSGDATMTNAGAVTVTGSAGNFTVTGDLIVSGDTTTVNTATLSVEDPLIILASGNNAADSVDIGLYGLYDTSGSQDLYSGLFRDANDSGKWKLFKDLQAAPTTTVNTSGTGYAVGTLVAAVEGNASTATALETARTIGGVSFDGTGNISLVSGSIPDNAADTTGLAATATKIASITNSNIVQLTETQTLTNKTLTSPDINGGTISAFTIDGNWTAASQTCADLGSVTTCDINGGTINGITDLAVADGGTGASTAGAALTALGAEASANKITKLLSGDGSNTTYSITHGYGTPIVQVQVLDYGNAGSGATYDVVQVEIERDSDNAVDIIFCTAPSATEDYLVLISKFPAIS